jgi:hypothetical protein
LLFLSENGFNRVDEIKSDSIYGFNKMAVTEAKLLERVNFVCEVFKNQLDKISKRTDNLQALRRRKSTKWSCLVTSL